MASEGLTPGDTTAAVFEAYRGALHKRHRRRPSASSSKIRGQRTSRETTSSRSLHPGPRRGGSTAATSADDAAVLGVTRKRQGRTALVEMAEEEEEVVAAEVVDGAKMTRETR